MGGWEHGWVGAWVGGSMGGWERGSMGGWEHGRVGAWVGGSMGGWEGGAGLGGWEGAARVGGWAGWEWGWAGAGWVHRVGVGLGLESTVTTCFSTIVSFSDIVKSWDYFWNEAGLFSSQIELDPQPSLTDGRTPIQKRSWMSSNGTLQKRIIIGPR